ncbi:Fis family transcriptional regulator [Pseudoalteromonas 'SMAR']|uniref:Fis family transcriptional regulator n=1 Tax=Pseudoalteromonas 'SMAR' TaxID=3416908 RepID=UPI003AF1EC2F
MRKTDKKTDKQLRQALTQVCDMALEHVSGFQWLTHQVTYPRVDDTLKVTCVFDTNEQLQTYLNSEQASFLANAIQFELSSIGVKIKAKHGIHYDSEEECNKHHNGNWAKRLS